MPKSHSFSTKTKHDLDLVEKYRQEAKRTGRTFSWYVLQALKQLDAQRGEANVRRKD